jgi:predicted DNA-binding protein with PD1-like motif
MQSKEEHDLIIIRLFPGDDLFQSLKEICRKHEVETAIFLSAVGQLKQFTLGYFDGKEYLYQDFAAVHELLSISGMISLAREENDYKFHLHATVANTEKQASGGHLFRGIIEGTGEIVLQKSPIKVQRKKDEATGLTGLYLE